MKNKTDKVNELINKLMDEINSSQEVKLTTEITLTGTSAMFYRALKVAQEIYGIGGVDLDNEIFILGIQEMIQRVWASYSLAFFKGQQLNIDDDGKLKN